MEEHEGVDGGTDRKCFSMNSKEGSSRNMTEFLEEQEEFVDAQEREFVVEQEGLITGLCG